MVYYSAIQPLEAGSLLNKISCHLSPYSLGHGLRTLTALPRSTQPSALRGTVNDYGLYGLHNNNNGDGGCGW